MKGINPADFPIPSNRCRDGADLCLDNAIRLLHEAKLLFENERYLTSCCLAIYALEEIAKGRKLLEFSQNGNDVTKKEWERLTRGRAHVEKIINGRKMAIKRLEERFPFTLKMGVPGSLLNGRFEEAHRIFARYSQWLKEQCLYVGWERSNWVFPMKFTMINQMTFNLALVESFEGCKSLAQEMGRDISSIDEDGKEFEKIFYQRFNELYDKIPADTKKAIEKRIKRLGLS